MPFSDMPLVPIFTRQERILLTVFVICLVLLFLVPA